MWSGLEVSPSVYPSKLSYLYTIPISQKTGRGGVTFLFPEPAWRSINRDISGTKYAEGREKDPVISVPWKIESIHLQPLVLHRVVIWTRIFTALFLKIHLTTPGTDNNKKYQF